MSKVILVTGAGTGIGRLTVRSLAAAGHRVHATMRDPEGRNAAKAAELREYASEHAADLRVVELDVLSESMVLRTACDTRGGPASRRQVLADERGEQRVVDRLGFAVMT